MQHIVFSLLLGPKNFIFQMLSFGLILFITRIVGRYLHSIRRIGNNQPLPSPKRTWCMCVFFRFAWMDFPLVNVTNRLEAPHRLWLITLILIILYGVSFFDFDHQVRTIKICALITLPIGEPSHRVPEHF